MTERKHPRYAAVQTLLDCSGGPDLNRRTIVDSWNDFENVCIFNNDMRAWRIEDQWQLEICLEALNANAKGTDNRASQPAGGPGDRAGE